VKRCLVHVTCVHEFCGRCGRRVDQIWTAPDPLFAVLHGSLRGCLCLVCFDRLARARGVLLRWVPVDLRDEAPPTAK
jgi:hypothetical protein